MRIYLIILIFFLFNTKSFSSVKEIKKMVYKSEKYNLGLKKKRHNYKWLKIKTFNEKKKHLRML